MKNVAEEAALKKASWPLTMAPSHVAISNLGLWLAKPSLKSHGSMDIVFLVLLALSQVKLRIPPEKLSNGTL